MCRKNQSLDFGADSISGSRVKTLVPRPSLEILWVETAVSRKGQSPVSSWSSLSRITFVYTYSLLAYTAYFIYWRGVSASG